MQPTTITIATARRIAKAHNQHVGHGGQLAFGPEGEGGEWYTSGTDLDHAEFPPEIVFSVKDQPLTARQVQADFARRVEDERSYEAHQAEMERSDRIAAIYREQNAREYGPR